MQCNTNEHLRSEGRALVVLDSRAVSSAHICTVLYCTGWYKLSLPKASVRHSLFVRLLEAHVFHYFIGAARFGLQTRPDQTRQFANRALSLRGHSERVRSAARPQKAASTRTTEDSLCSAGGRRAELLLCPPVSSAGQPHPSLNRPERDAHNSIISAAVLRFERFGALVWQLGSFVTVLQMY